MRIDELHVQSREDDDSHWLYDWCDPVFSLLNDTAVRFKGRLAVAHTELDNLSINTGGKGTAGGYFATNYAQRA